MVIDGNCDLAGRGGAGDASDVNYAIMDDRQATRPAALSGVIWARPHPLAMNRLARWQARGTVKGTLVERVREALSARSVRSSIRRLSTTMTLTISRHATRRG